MESVDPLDKHLDPPDSVDWVDCCICGETHDVADMKQVGGRFSGLYVCDFLGADDCLEEYNRRNSDDGCSGVEQDCPWCHGTALDVSGNSGGSCPHCFNGDEIPPGDHEGRLAVDDEALPF